MEFVVERRVSRCESIRADSLEQAERLAKSGTGTDETLLSVMTKDNWLAKERGQIGKN